MHSTSRNIAVQVKQLPKVNSILAGYYANRQDYATAVAPAICPHLMDAGEGAQSTEVDWDKAVPYKKIPGPRPIPILGNTFR